MNDNSILQAYGPGYPDRGIKNLDAFPFYFEFTGAPFDDGIFYGCACKKALQKILAEDRFNALWGWASLPKDEINPILASAENIIGYYPEYREELRGMARGAELPYDDLLLATLLPEASIAIGKVPATQPTGCTVCSYRDDEKTIVGNNIDNPPRYTVTHVKRKGHFAYITIFYLGRIYCGGPAINEHGLTMASTGYQGLDWHKMVIAGKKIKAGQGSCGYIENRRILEKARTVAEALVLIEERVNLFRSQCLLLADAQGDLAIVSQDVGFRSCYRPKERRIACPNLCFDRTYIEQVLGMTPEQYRLEWQTNPAYADRFERYNTLAETYLDKTSSVDMDTMWKLMRLPPYVCRGSTAITAVMNPREKKMLVAQGNNPLQTQHALVPGQLLK